MDEPIVSREVDPPETMPVTMTAVEIATGPPAPAVAPVVCSMLELFFTLKIEGNLQNCFRYLKSR